MFGNNAIFCLTGSDVKPATVAAVVEAARDKIKAIA
jgi:hypothetical protein